MKEKQRIVWVDIAKGLGIILMILGHMPSIPDWFHDWIFSFHMPLFFFVSGYFFKERNAKLQLTVTAKSYLVPYLLYSLIFIAIDFAMFRDIYEAQNSLQRMITGQGGFDVPWFFISIFLTHNFYNMIYIISKDAKIRLMLIVAISCIGYVLTTNHMGEIFKFSTSLVSIIFYAVGHYYKRFDDSLKGTSKTIMWLITCLLVSFVTVFSIRKIGLQVLDINSSVYGNLIMTLIAFTSGVLAIVFFSKLVEKCKMSVLLKYIGSNSLFFFPLMTYVPVRIVSCAEKWIIVTSWMKLLSKVIGFIVTFCVCWCFEKHSNNRNNAKKNSMEYFETNKREKH